MKNLKIKNYHIPSYMIDAIELQVELHFLKEQVEIAKTKMEAIQHKKREHAVMLVAAHQFRTLLEKCYPKECNTIVIKAQIERLEEMDFESLTELRDFFASILFAIYFSEGEDKVVDLNDPQFFDDEKCQKLFDQEIYVPEGWLDQFITCLIKRDAEEDMILHNLTPEWLWPRCFTMLLELYKNTAESIKNNK